MIARRLNQLKALAPCGALLLIILVGSSCGSDSTPAGSGQSITTEDSQASGDRIIRANGWIKGQNACRSAWASVGSKPRGIDFMVSCSGHKPGKVFFAVQRHYLGDLGSRVKIDSFTRSPLVKGKGAVSDRGRCFRRMNLITCTVVVDGPVEVSGFLSVSPGSRCASAVSVTGLTSPPCHREYCSGDLMLDGLFNARPKGCAAWR